MSTDTLNTAFATLRSEIPERESKIKTVVDLCPDRFRRTLLFLGVTPRDVENASFWNELFARRGSTVQTVTARKSQPAKISWTGIRISGDVIRLASSNLSKRILTLEAKITTKSDEANSIKEELAIKSVFANAQNLDSLESQIITLQSEKARCAEELGFLERIRKNAQQGEFRTPILIPGKSEVELRFISDKPVAQQYISYLADNVVSRGITWDQITALAPKEAITLFEGAKVPYKANPMPEDLIKELVQVRDHKKEMAPKARSNWPPKALAAYYWYCTIRTYNHVWGATGAVSIDRRIKDDRRFANRANKAGVKEAQPKPTPVKKEMYSEAALMRMMQATFEKMMANARYTPGDSKGADDEETRYLAALRKAQDRANKALANAHKVVAGRDGEYTSQQVSRAIACMHLADVLISNTAKEMFHPTSNPGVMPSTLLS